MDDLEKVGLAEDTKKEEKTTSYSKSDDVTMSDLTELYEEFKNTKNELQSSMRQHKEEMAEMNEKIDGISADNVKLKQQVKQLLAEKNKADGHRAGMSTEPDPKLIRGRTSRSWELPDWNRISAVIFHLNWWRVICLVVIGATMISALGAGFVALYAGFQSLLSGVAFSRGIAATSVGVTSGAYFGAILGSIGGGWLGYKTSQGQRW